MAAGIIYTEIDLDSRKFDTAKNRIIYDAKTMAVNVEDAWKTLGKTSDTMFDMMRRQASNAFERIKIDSKSSAAERVRAEEAMNAKLKTLNEQQFGVQTSLLDSLKSHWMAVSAAVVGAFYAMGKVFALAELGAQIKSIEESFVLMTRNAGIAGNELISNLKKITNETIDDSDLIKKATRLIAEGFSAEQIVQVGAAARVAARLMGTEVTAAYEQVADAIVNLRQRGLKTAGFVIDLEEAYKKHATALGVDADRLNNYGKQMALMKAVYEKTIELQEKLGITHETASERIQQQKTIWKELHEEIAKAASSLWDYITAQAEAARKTPFSFMKPGAEVRGGGWIFRKGGIEKYKEGLEWPIEPWPIIPPAKEQLKPIDLEKYFREQKPYYESLAKQAESIEKMAYAGWEEKGFWAQLEEDKKRNEDTQQKILEGWIDFYAAREEMGKGFAENQDFYAKQNLESDEYTRKQIEEGWIEFYALREEMQKGFSENQSYYIEKNLEEWKESQKNVFNLAKSLQDAFTQVFDAMISGTLKAKDAFKSFFLAIARDYMKPFIQEMSNAISSLFSAKTTTASTGQAVAGTGTSGGGLFGSFGSLLGKGIGTGLTVGSVFNAVTNQSGKAATGGMIGGALGGIAAGAVMSSAIGFGAQLVVTSIAQSVVGYALGAAIGSYVPVIGTIIGAIIGWALGSLLGGGGGTSKMQQYIQAMLTKRFKTYYAMQALGFEIPVTEGKFDVAAIREQGGLLGIPAAHLSSAKLKDLWAAAQEIYKAMSEDFGNAMKVGLQAGSFKTFERTLRSSIYENILEGMIKAFTEASTLKQILIPLYQYIYESVANAMLKGFDIVTFKVEIEERMAGLAPMLKSMESIFQVLYSATKELRGEVMGGGGNITIPSFQHGGIMPYTGLAIVHKGEPVGKQTMQPVTVNMGGVTVGNGMDVTLVGHKLGKMVWWATKKPLVFG